MSDLAQVTEAIAKLVAGPEKTPAQIGKLKIESVSEPTGKAPYFVKFEGLGSKFKCFQDSFTKLEWKQGQEVEVTASWQLNNYQGNESKELWIVAPKAQKGGGGGRYQEPRDNASIAAQVCVKGAVDIAVAMIQSQAKMGELGAFINKTALELASAYEAAYKKIKEEVKHG